MEDRLTVSIPKGSDDGPLEGGRRWPSACQPSSYQSRLRRGANVGELFNSVRHSRAGSSHSSLIVVLSFTKFFVFLR